MAGYLGKTKIIIFLTPSSWPNLPDAFPPKKVIDLVEASYIKSYSYVNSSLLIEEEFLKLSIARGIQKHFKNKN